MASAARVDAHGLDATGRGLSLYLFSSFRVVRNSEPVNGGLSGKARQLLKILAANRRRWVTRDALLEALWPAGDPGAGAVSLKVVAHRLRTALDPDREHRDPGAWVLAENGTYRLNPAASIWIDAEAFQDSYEQARSWYAQGRFAEARQAFGHAEGLYSGDYLEEDMYDDWTVLRREELRDLYLDSLHRLARLALDDQAHTDVIRYCHKIVLADPCREDAYRMLMGSHAALNQYARAGAWYAVCRATLAREVAAAPSHETIDAFERLFNAPRTGVMIPSERRSPLAPPPAFRR